MTTQANVQDSGACLDFFKSHFSNFSSLSSVTVHLEEQNVLLKQHKKTLQIKKEEYESKRKQNSNSFSSCREELDNLESNVKDQLNKFYEFDLAGNMQKLDEMNKQTIIY